MEGDDGRGGAVSVRIINAHVLAGLRQLPDASVHCCVTSPPYFGLRSYGTEPQVWGGDPGHAHCWQATETTLEQGSKRRPSDDGIAGRNRATDKAVPVVVALTSAFCSCGAWRGELGAEPTPELFVAHLVEVFREVRRVLHPSGVLFLNLGDSYSSDPRKGGSGTPNGRNNRGEGYDRRGRATAPGRYRLRSDLTPEQVAYVLEELAAARKIPKESSPEVAAGVDGTVAPFAGSE